MIERALEITRAARGGLARGKKVAAALRRMYFPKQAAAVTSKARLVAGQCNRRAGKSVGFGAEMLARANEEPDFRGYYITETRTEAKRVWWEQPEYGVERLNQVHEMGGQINQTLMQIKFPGGGSVQLLGADSKSDMNRVRGVLFDVLWIDEAQKLGTLDEFLRQVAGMASADRKGQVWMTGTPADICEGTFYEVTKPGSEYTNWDVHHWYSWDNPHFGHTFEERFHNSVIETCLEYNLVPESLLPRLHLLEPEVLELLAPEVQREAFGRWVSADSSYVYAVPFVDQEQLYYCSRGDNPLENLPKVPLIGGRERAKDWMVIASYDLGYSPDPFAWYIGAWSPEDSREWELDSGHENKLTESEQLELIEAHRKRWNPRVIIADAKGSAKATVKGWSQDLVRRYGIPVCEAKWGLTVPRIRLANADIRNGRVKRIRNSMLDQEQRHLLWKPRKIGQPVKEWSDRKITQPDGSEWIPGNHCSDAWLYARDYAHEYLGKTPDDPIEPGSSAWFEAREDRWTKSRRRK